MSQCPLDDPNLDIIPESYHLMGKCLCFLCTCNTHKCQNTSPKRQNPDTFITNYAQAYQSFTPTPPPLSYKPEPSRYTPKKALTWETTSRTDYKPHAVSNSPHRKMKIDHSHTPLKFIGESQYKEQYPHWGQNRVFYMDKPQQPVHYFPQIGLSGVSTYKQTYQNASLNKTEIFRREQAKPSPIARKFSGESTSRSTYKSFEGVSPPQRVKVLPERYVPVESALNHFMTQSRNDYEVKTVRLKNPLRYMKSERKVFNRMQGQGLIFLK